MLEKWKATYSLSNLISSQQILKKTAALVLTMILLLNALLLIIQYTHQHHWRQLGHLLSEGQGLGVESAHWRQQ
jgi:cell division protein FtsL